LKKRIVLVLAAVLLAAQLCSCGLISVGTGSGGKAHKELMDEVRELAQTAALQYDVGLTFESEYLYGLAQAGISSLRLCVDTVLWLRGEGADLGEVTGDAPYRTWDEIASAGPGSALPFYFEGLIHRFRGEKEKAEDCFKRAGSNPLYKERDFYYLRNMSPDALYSLKEEAAELEREIFEAYTPRTSLVAGRTGAEFSPAYHLALAAENEDDPSAAAVCALNALLTDPLAPALYANAAVYEIAAGNAGLAVEILNDGLFLAPDDEALKYVAGMFARSAGEATAASAESSASAAAAGRTASAAVSPAAYSAGRAAAAGVLSSGSVGLQERSWIEHLRPAGMPGSGMRTSYPVELLVGVASHKQVRIGGTCALEGGLTDRDLADAMIEAARGVDGYKSPENAVTDKLRIAELQHGLSFTPEEQERLVRNFLSLVGMDKIADILRGKLPTYGETDAVGTVVGMIMSGKLPDAKSLLPYPTSVSGFSQSLVINGVFISVDQYKRDQQKYQDIVELSNARARFREFNAGLNRIVKEKARKNTFWTIRIQSRTVEDQLYRGTPEIVAPYIYTADIVLEKRDGRYEDPVGTYQGSFSLDIDVSLLEYDRTFAQSLADSINERLKETNPGASQAMMWRVISHSANRDSENRTTLGCGNVYMALSGSLGGVFEMRLDPSALDITYSRIVHDHVSVLEKKGEGGTETLTWTDITDSETGTAYHQDHTRIVDAGGKVTESTNTDDDAYQAVDPRGYLTLTLVVDMAG
jgi:hypothetical protein